MPLPELITRLRRELGGLQMRVPSPAVEQRAASLRQYLEMLQALATSLRAPAQRKNAAPACRATGATRAAPRQDELQARDGEARRRDYLMGRLFSGQASAIEQAEAASLMQAVLAGQAETHKPDMSRAHEARIRELERRAQRADFILAHAHWRRETDPTTGVSRAWLMFPVPAQADVGEPAARERVVDDSMRAARIWQRADPPQASARGEG